MADIKAIAEDLLRRYPEGCSRRYQETRRCEGC